MQRITPVKRLRIELCRFSSFAQRKHASKDRYALEPDGPRPAEASLIRTPSADKDVCELPAFNATFWCLLV
jgi:hypothetical protein